MTGRGRRRDVGDAATTRKHATDPPPHNRRKSCTFSRENRETLASNTDNYLMSSVQRWTGVCANDDPPCAVAIPNVYWWEWIVGAAASPARLSFVIGEFLSHRIRILSYTPQLPFKVGKFADSAKNAHPLNGMMNDDDQKLPLNAPRDSFYDLNSFVLS